MNHDSFLEVGSQHKVCEDFISSGNDPCSHVILSDGCSASENTNYGAMILVQLAKRYLDFNRNKLGAISYDVMGDWIICRARTIVESMGLNLACLDATLIISYVWDGAVCVYMYGDGYIITKSLEERHCYEIFFPSGFPYYLSYRIDIFRLKAYRDSGHLRVLKKSRLQEGRSVVLCEVSRKPDLSNYYLFDSVDFREVYVASDGINSFVRNGEKLLVGNAIEKFLDIEKENRDRNTKGVFIQRRCRKAIRGFRKDGWDHYDDISFGGFLCGTT